MANSNLQEYRRRVCRAMDYIAKHLDENPSLDDIARAAPFSKFHFHRIFRSFVGETVGEFTRRLRLERAANALLLGDKDITTIAHECGFSSSQNFAKAFRKHFDQSPSEFREHRKRGNIESNGGNALSDDRWQDALIAIDDIAQHERSNSMKVEVKEMPAHHVAYVRAIGPYGVEVCGSAFEKLMRWAGPRGLAGKGPSLGVCWDNPEVTPPEKCRYDACLPVPEGTKVDGDVALQTIEGGQFAVLHCEIDPDGFSAAWDELMCKWMPSSGYQPGDRPCYELCHSDPSTHPEGKFVVDICCPVKPL